MHEESGRIRQPVVAPELRSTKNERNWNWQSVCSLQENGMRSYGIVQSTIGPAYLQYPDWHRFPRWSRLAKTAASDCTNSEKL